MVAPRFLAWLHILLAASTFMRADPQIRDPALAARIKHLLGIVLVEGDEQKTAAAAAQVRRIFTERGLPSIADVGDEFSYGFVLLLTMSEQPLFLKEQALPRIQEAAARHRIPQDAATFYRARYRLEKMKQAAAAQPPKYPALRDAIERLIKVDQAVRQKQGFDKSKMMEVDRQNSAAVRGILEKYGVPTLVMVGPKAASDFVDLIQHQPPEFRAQALPKLKANVEAGQADPEAYALVYDRSQTDQGKKQLYGENLVCTGGKLVEAPIENAAHVNERRAAMGLMRIELYARVAAEISPDLCAGLTH